MASGEEPSILAFPSATAWEAWLDGNGASPRGIWLKIAKKAAGIPTVTYDEAVDVALCHGWIDGQRKTHDEDHFVQRFTPRRPASLWSKRNIERASRLIEAGRMRPAGLSEVEAAQRDGRWEAAYDAQRDMVIPEDFLRALEGNPAAQTFFEGLGRSERFVIGWRLQAARTPEARQRRFAALLGRLERGEPLVKRT